MTPGRHTAIGPVLALGGVVSAGPPEVWDSEVGIMSVPGRALRTRKVGAP